MKAEARLAVARRFELRRRRAIETDAPELNSLCSDQIAAPVEFGHSIELDRPRLITGDHDRSRAGNKGHRITVGRGYKMMEIGSFEKDRFLASRDTAFPRFRSPQIDDGLSVIRPNAFISAKRRIRVTDDRHHG